VSSEKKQLQALQSSDKVPKAIRLKPSTTDYATFAKTTAKVLGLTGAAAAKTRPSKRVLSLMNLGS
jgi:hypothetical protein